MRTVFGHESTLVGIALVLVVGVVMVVADIAVAERDAGVGWAGGDVVWTRQFGTDATDSGHAVAIDGTGIYVAGRTGGVLGGPDAAGSGGEFLRKYDTDGNVVWTRQFQPFSNKLLSVAADATGVYVAGTTSGTLPGQTSAGGDDVFVVKYSAVGDPVWSRQFGTEWDDTGSGVAAGASGVYVAGTATHRSPSRQNLLVAKYDTSGNLVWVDETDTGGNDYGWGGVAVLSSGIYVAGGTSGTFPGETNFGGHDVFLRRYDESGSVAWTRQFGTDKYDTGRGVAAGPSGVYVTGRTAGAFPGQVDGPSEDVFLTRFKAAGSRLWTRQFGQVRSSDLLAVAVGASGAYVAGSTEGALPGETSAGRRDGFVRKYSRTGGAVWTDQLGTDRTDFVFGVATATSGVYVTGRTGGELPGQASAGSSDAFVRKYQAPACMGLPVTVGGTDASETLVGTPGDDVIHGWGGDDVLIGKGGNDVICGGEGNDLLQGKDGDDRLGGGPGNDKLNGGLGDDALNGGGGKDQAVYYAAVGGAQVDLLAGTATGHGSDTLTRIEHVMGSPANDMLRGDKHRNILKGLAGDDALYGKAGDDVLYGGDGIDALKGGPDHDECTRGEVYESCEVIR